MTYRLLPVALLMLAILIGGSGCMTPPAADDEFPSSGPVAAPAAPAVPVPATPSAGVTGESSAAAPLSAAAQAQIATAVDFAKNVVEGQFGMVAPPLGEVMKEQLTAERLRRMSAKLASSFGKAVSVGTPRTKKEKGFDIVYVPYTFERGTQDVKVVFDGTGMIRGLWLVKHGAD